MQKGRIKIGAKVNHGGNYDFWPVCRPPGHEYFHTEYSFTTKFPDAVFEVIWIESDDQEYWECSRFGYGKLETGSTNGFGNGKILVFGKENVELIDD